MTTQPLIDYLEAREFLLQGERAEAIAALERALGSPPGNPVLGGSVERLLDHRALAGEVVLHLVAYESARRRSHA